MKSSYRLGNLFGIEIRIHVTFLLIIAWALWRGWNEGGWREGVWSAIFVLCVFAGIVLHEIGHSLVARHFKVNVHAITLFPIGGVAGLSRIPRRPWQELLIALAGPAVSAALAGLLLLARRLGHPAVPFPRIGTTAGALLDAVALANLVLAAFNLIPAFPMDGGRVLRALLALFLRFDLATAIAAAMGQILAVGFAAFGVYQGQPFIVALGVMLVLLARRENASVRRQARLSGRYVSDLMDLNAPRFAPDAPIAAAADWQLHDYCDFPVLVHDELVGLLDPDLVRRAMREGRGAEPVASVMRRRFLALPPDAPLSEIAGWLTRGGQRAYPVVENGGYLGLLRVDSVLAAADGLERPSRSGLTIDLG